MAATLNSGPADAVHQLCLILILKDKTDQERHRDRDPLLPLVDLYRGVYRDLACREQSQGCLGISFDRGHEESWTYQAW
jgi:hypothetical protein